MNKHQSGAYPDPQEISAAVQGQEALDVGPLITGPVVSESAQLSADLQITGVAPTVTASNPVGDITIDLAAPALAVPARKRHPQKAIQLSKPTPIPFGSVRACSISMLRKH